MKFWRKPRILPRLPACPARQTASHQHGQEEDQVRDAADIARLG
jgi:hypothetical protein